MDAIEALGRARHEFQSRLARVTDDQWDLPTPCAEWSVRDLVNHVLLGTRMSVQLLGGVAKADVIAALGDNLITDTDAVLADFTALADDMHAGFAAPEGLRGTVDHPMGEIPKTTFIGFRMLDYSAHAWDLARGIGADDSLDPELVAVLWAAAEPDAEQLAATGIFGDGQSGDLAESAPLQNRWLDVLGRRP